MDALEIRLVTAEDAPGLLKVYEHYVRHTAISFEYEVPTLEEFRARIARTRQKYPYFAAVENGRILGYAYAGPFVGRKAYDWSAELTVYLAPEAKGRGLGRKLYEALENALAGMGVLNLYACIGYPEEEDEYLTRNSAEFHAHMGFSPAGRFRQCGYKFDRWYDMIWMEKIIGKHENGQKPVRPFPDAAR
ncbi:MAG: N-acetyltransferase [Oscillibacter sp.]|nr:N-acetyltransferase [Oscillibacter sp.]